MPITRRNLFQKLGLGAVANVVKVIPTNQASAAQGIDLTNLVVLAAKSNQRFLESLKISEDFGEGKIGCNGNTEDPNYVAMYTAALTTPGIENILEEIKNTIVKTPNAFVNLQQPNAAILKDLFGGVDTLNSDNIDERLSAIRKVIDEIKLMRHRKANDFKGKHIE